MSRSINCGMNYPLGGKNRGGVSFYRYIGNNTISAYHIPAIALS